MHELIIKDGDAFIVGGTAFVRKGVYFVDTSNQNSHHKTSTMRMGSRFSYVDGLLTVNGESFKLVWA